VIASKVVGTETATISTLHLAQSFQAQPQNQFRQESANTTGIRQIEITHTIASNPIRIMLQQSLRDLRWQSFGQNDGDSVTSLV
jgi:hypothetical protein